MTVEDTPSPAAAVSTTPPPPERSDSPVEQNGKVGPKFVWSPPPKEALRGLCCDLGRVHHSSHSSYVSSRILHTGIHYK